MREEMVIEMQIKSKVMLVLKKNIPVEMHRL